MYLARGIRQCATIQATIAASRVVISLVGSGEDGSRPVAMYVAYLDVAYAVAGTRFQQQFAHGLYEATFTLVW